MSPVLLDIKNQFHYPKKETSTELTFDWYEDRLIYCPGSQLSIRVGGQDANLVAIPAEPFALPPVVRCVQGTKFVLQHNTLYQMDVTLDQFHCSEWPKASPWLIPQQNNQGQWGDKQCSNLNGNIGKLMGLGIQLDERTGKSLPSIEVCYEDARATTLWSRHFITPGIRGRLVFKTPSNKPR